MSGKCNSIFPAWPWLSSVDAPQWWLLNCIIDAAQGPQDECKCWQASWETASANPSGYAKRRGEVWVQQSGHSWVYPGLEGNPWSWQCSVQSFLGNFLVQQTDIEASFLELTTIEINSGGELVQKVCVISKPWSTTSRRPGTSSTRSALSS